MFKNYLLIAFRVFRKYKLFSFLNSAGLAVGMACSILIMLYVRFELSFDRYHSKADRIYRVVAQQPGNVFLGTDHFAVTQAILAPTLKAEFPEVEQSVSIDMSNNVLVSVGGKNFFESGVLWAKPEVFDIFDFALVAGDPATALNDPYDIILTETIVRKYFGDENPVGKTIRYQDKFDLTVTGVMRDIPKNSHFVFGMMGSFETLIAMSEYKDQYRRWGNSSFYTYVLLRPGSDPAAFEEKLKEVVRKYHNEDWRDKKNPHRYYLEPLTSIHLGSHINFDIGENNDIRYIYLLSGLAFIILLIACINYMNLTTARASRRAREVGMRKVVGANRRQLMWQFVGESILLTVGAGILSLLIVAIALPEFASLVERDLQLRMFLEPTFLAAFSGILLLVALVSGSYPALFLARFQPAHVLKGDLKDSSRSRFRNALVVAQFAATVALLVCTLTVRSQLTFIQSINLGFNREHVLAMRIRDSKARANFAHMKHDLLQDPHFIGVTRSSHLPTNISSSTGLRWLATGEDGPQVYQLSADADFLKVFDIRLVEGRNFSPSIATDSTDTYIINEATRDLAGWETAVGKPFGRGDKRDGKVIGVVKNFHMHSLKYEIKPLLIILDEGWTSYLSARISGNDIPGAVEAMRKVWERYSTKYPFDYFFVDDQYNRMYATEQRLGQVFASFTSLGIFIACLGLFGLSAFTAERKTKEIGIRKVLGASVGQMVFMLSRDLTKPVIIANLLAWPIAWYAMNGWLQNFAYRIDLGWFIFTLAGLIALLVAIATVSVQAVRAATGNPVNALRYE